MGMSAEELGSSTPETRGLLPSGGAPPGATPVLLYPQNTPKGDLSIAICGRINSLGVQTSFHLFEPPGRLLPGKAAPRKDCSPKKAAPREGCSPESLLPGKALVHTRWAASPALAPMGWVSLSIPGTQPASLSASHTKIGFQASHLEDIKVILWSPSATILFHFSIYLKPR